MLNSNHKVKWVSIDIELFVEKKTDLNSSKHFWPVIFITYFEYNVSHFCYSGKICISFNYRLLP